MNTNNPLTRTQAEDVYAILVSTCGAPESQTNEFVIHFTSPRPTSEWRFQGSLGFGGKYRHPEMTADFYPEDATPQRAQAARLANERLAAMKTIRPHERV